MINEMSLRRKNKILLLEKPCKEGRHDKSELYVATIMKNIENLGYTFSSQLYEMLCNYSEERLGDFYLELVEALKEQKGVNVKYNPMYPNFPSEVMEMDKVDLYINAVIHYISGGKLFPNINKEERLPLFEEGKIEALDIGTEEELLNIFSDLVNSKSSLSDTDKKDLEWFFKTYGYGILTYLPDEIPHKETLAIIYKFGLEYIPMSHVTSIDKHVKTATDVLRIAVAMSEGDVSLAFPCKFRKFTRRERKILLGLLERIPSQSREEDMVKYRERWCRLDYFLHSNEKRMKKLYPSTAESMKKLHEKKKIATYNKRTERLMEDVKFSKVNFNELVEHLSERPGEFGRRLDFLLREADTEDEIKLVIFSFSKIADKISTTELLEIREHFKQRNSDQEYRVFFPKGIMTKAYNIPNELLPIKEKYCHTIVNVCEEALIDLYEKREPMGKVYLADEYVNYIIPFSQRNTSKVLKTITRGSHISIGKDCNIIRGFIWWTNISNYDEAAWYERVDLDLAATFYDEKWNYRGHTSWTNLKTNSFKSYHSGDIVDGGPRDGDGVAEFLDVDIESALNAGIRYVVYQVYDYTAFGFDKLPHATFGWMEREDMNSGEIFEPKTVGQKMDLTSGSSCCVPVIFDLREREFVWADMATTWLGAGDETYRPNCLENHLGQVESCCYSVVNMSKPNLHDLITLNVLGRGEFVDDKEEADIVFDVNDGITPYDTEVFLGEYL